MINLDYLCIEAVQDIGNNGDKSILQKALGILQEDGIYAMFLWLEDKNYKNIRTSITKLLNKEEIKKYLLDSTNESFNDNFKEFCVNLQKIAENIDKLFFSKILERTLTYALYHTKIEGSKNVEKD